MKSTVLHIPQGVIVKIAELHVCAENVVGLKDSFLNLIHHGASNLIVDLGAVQSIDSSGIAALLQVLKRLGPQGELSLCDLQSQVERSFRITRMDRIFNIYPSLDAACESLRTVQLLKAA